MTLVQIRLMLLVLAAVSMTVLGEVAQGRAENPKTKDAAFKVKAADLTKECMADENKAMQKYQDKILQIEGEILESKKQVTVDDWYLRIKGHKLPDGQFAAVMCTFDPKNPDYAKVSKLKPGQSVVVRGQFQVQLGRVVQLRQPGMNLVEVKGAK